MYRQNRKNLLNRLVDNSVTVIYNGNLKHLSADAYFGFEPNRNFFYLTGLEKDKMILLMTKSDKDSSYLFIEENTELKAKWDGARMSKEEASAISGIEVANVRYIQDFNDFFKSISFCSSKSFF